MIPRTPLRPAAGICSLAAVLFTATLFPGPPLAAQVLLRTLTPGTQFVPLHSAGLTADVQGGRNFLEKNENTPSYLLSTTLKMPSTGEPSYRLQRLVVHFRTARYGASLQSVELRQGSDVLFHQETNAIGDYSSRESTPPSESANTWDFGNIPRKLSGQTTIVLGIRFPGGFEGGMSHEVFFLADVRGDFAGSLSSTTTHGPGAESFPSAHPAPAPTPSNPAPPSSPSHTPPATPAHPLPANLPDSHAVIYALTNDNQLLWNRHDGRDTGSFTWAATTSLPIGSGWAFTSVVGAADGVLYAVKENGDLVWYRHDGHGNGEWKWASADGKVVNSGFQGMKLATGPVGVLYAQKPNGDLLWFHHLGYRDGSDSWGDSRQGKLVATNWHYAHIFSGGAGIIYGIDRDGNLLRFLHEGVFNGSSKWLDPAGRQIATGWRYKTAFSSGDGILYALTADHQLLWFWDQGRHDDVVQWAHPTGTVVGVGWDVKTVFSGADLAIPDPPK